MPWVAYGVASLTLHSFTNKRTEAVFHLLGVSGADMVIHISELMSEIYGIKHMADGAVSFKSKCRAMRANAMHLLEFLYDLVGVEKSHAGTLEHPLKVVKDVLLEAEQFVKRISQLGWLQEVWKMKKTASEVHVLERKFTHAQKGTITPFLHIDHNRLMLPNISCSTSD